MLTTIVGAIALMMGALVSLQVRSDSHLRPCMHVRTHVSNEHVRTHPHKHFHAHAHTHTHTYTQVRAGVWIPSLREARGPHLASWMFTLGDAAGALGGPCIYLATHMLWRLTPTAWLHLATVTAVALVAIAGLLAR